MNEILVTPRVLISSEHKLAMYWSPKAGCSSVAKIMLSLMNIYDPTKSVIKQRDKYTAGLVKKYCVDGVEVPQKLLCNQHHMFYADYVKAQVVRNPFSRVIASFLKYLETNIPIQRSFKNYLYLIKDNPSFEHHMLQQFMTDQINDILYLETLQNDLLKFCEKYHFNLEYVYHTDESYSKFIKLDIKENYSDTIIGFSKNHVPYTIYNNNIIYGIPIYKYFYDNESKELVQHIYEKDLSYFKYEYPYE